MRLKSVDIEEIDWIKGVAYPRGVRYREIVVTGPPCSGKTTLILRLGGWPEEGCIDLADKHWWRNRILTFRPREVHFAIPFKGFYDSVSVFNRAWLAAPTAIDYGRIQVPPGKKRFLQIDWRKRFIFDFQLPPTEQIYSIRRNRALAGSHPVDIDVSESDVELQSSVYENLALHLQHCGMRVIVRNEFSGMPRCIVDADMTDERA